MCKQPIDAEESAPLSQLIALSAFWSGYRITDFQVNNNRVNVRLEPDGLSTPMCSGCGHACAAVHDCQWRRIRDLPMLGRHVELDVLTRCQGVAQWLEHARQSEIPALMWFANLLKPYWVGES